MLRSLRANIPVFTGNLSFFSCRTDMSTTVKNVMEILAKNYLDANISELGLKFPCEKCKNDVLAFSLNRLQPKYVSNVRGHAFVKAQMMTNQYKTDIITALTKAVHVINENPGCSLCECEECPKSSSF